VKQSFGVGFIAGSVMLSIAVVMAGYRVPGNARLAEDGTSLAGTWRGESICVDKTKFPACQDERVVYHIARSNSASDGVTITMDKIVNGKPEMMAVLDFKYDGQKGTWMNEFTRNTVRGVWTFTVKENAMEGTLIVLPDKTLVRRINLKKT
jgi:hypothetical protein